MGLGLLGSQQLNQGKLLETKFIHGGHRSRVTDLSWNPFEKGVVASTEEGSVVQVWQMSERLLKDE